MSRVFLTLSVVLYCLGCYQAKAGNSTNSDSLLTEAILNYDYSKFVGKTLGEFLSTNPIANYKKRRYYEAKIGVLKGLRLTYAKNLVVIPVIKNFSYVKPFAVVGMSIKPASNSADAIVGLIDQQSKG